MDNSKKKIVARKDVVDFDGNIMQACILSAGAVDKNFTKVFHESLVNRLEENMEGMTYMKKSIEGILMFHQLISMMSYDNHLRATQEDIAEKMGRNVSSVKRLIQGLEKADILMCMGHRDYMFSPEVICKVRNGERQDMLNEWFCCKGKKKTAQLEKGLGSETDDFRV